MNPTQTKILACCLAALALSSAFSGCSSLGVLRPALTAAALTLLHELDALLRSYEAAQTPKIFPRSGIAEIQRPPEELFADIHALLDVCDHEIPTKVLLPYRARLEAAARHQP